MKKLLLTLCLTLTAMAAIWAQRTVTGTVTDEKGEPLIGASVVVKGTTIGTAVDVDGKYSVNTPQEATLVFSFAGFSTQEIALGASNVVDVKLAEGAALNELVVTAFGIKKDKSNLGYAVAQLNNDELTLGRTTNVTNALAGKVAGIRIGGSGGSFSSSSIFIRGFTSFTGSNQPLFVIDGIQVDNSGGGNTLQAGVTSSSRAIDINQDDIESMSVLKGAAATSLYGSRGANGVILITTKKGKAGQKNSISYTANFATQTINRLPDYQNEFGQGAGGNFNPAAISSWGPRIAGQRVILPADYRTGGAGDSTSMGAFPDNVRDLFQTGSNMQHNLSFQGSSGVNTYRLSLGYLDDKGVIDNNRLKRYNVGINASSEITKKLTANISINYALNKSVRTAQGNQLSNPLFRSWFTPRSWDLTGRPWQNATGGQMHYDGVVDNPRWSIYNNLYDDQTDRAFGNFSLRYQINSWLSAEYKLGLDQFSTAYSAYDQIGARGGAFTNANTAGGIRERRDISRILNSTFFLSANKKVGNDLDLTFLLGQEAVDQYRNNSDIIGRGLTVRNFRNLNANSTSFLTSYETWQYRLLGYFANATAVWKNWATVDASVRLDQNSILPKANNTYAYYSVALTANLLQAIPSLKSEALTGLKIRANTGLTGRATPDFRYSTDTYYGTSNPLDGFGPQIVFPYNGLPGFTLNNTAGNPALKPEFTRSSEIGIEAGFLKDRITLEATIYQQKSTDIILSVPYSPTSGITNIVSNAGSMTTTGFEAVMTLVPIKTKSGSWSVTGNFTRFRSIVDELAPGVQNIFLGGFTTPNIRLVAGDEYGQIYGNAYLRDAQGRMIINANGLPAITNNVQKIGNPNPRWTLGVTNTITYKGWTFNAVLDIRKGGDQYSRNLADLQRNGTVVETTEKPRFNTDGTVARNWRFDGVFADGTPNNVDVTAEQYWGNSGKFVAAEGFVFNTSWFRIREAGLTYALPKKWLEKTPFGALDLGIFGRNLFLYAPNYPHLDPEQSVLGVSNAQGLEFNALPQTRSVGANLRVTF